MTDKELLELAAKANGGLVYVQDMGWIYEDAEGNRGSWWNPLGDDGDALKLAVKLRFNIEIDAHEVFVAGKDAENHQLFEWHCDDAMKATRRAIVRAAAEIGKKNDRPATTYKSR